MRILDDFLETEQLRSWQKLVLMGTKQGTIFDPEGMKLFKEVKRMIPLPFLNAYYYKIEPGTTPNPHIDSKQFAVIYYPFDSEGGLALYDSNWSMFDVIPVKANRLILFNCGEAIHSQIPSTREPRYSVVFKFQNTTKYCMN